MSHEQGNGLHVPKLSALAASIFFHYTAWNIDFSVLEGLRIEVGFTSAFVRRAG